MEGQHASRSYSNGVFRPRSFSTERKPIHGDWRSRAHDYGKFLGTKPSCQKLGPSSYTRASFRNPLERHF